jgi:cystathionine beta-lyase/cystathionine gamma-synthase
MTRAFDDDLAAGFGTRAIHAGQRPDPLTGAIMTPVYLTSTYVQEGLGQNKGYEYARGKNPTREAFERNVAALENGRHGFAFSSGMGCLDSIMKLFKAGDHVVCAENVYGGTFRLYDKILQNFGLTFSYVDTRDPQRVADAMRPETRLVLVETPSNPLMRLTDIAAAAEIAHRGRALLVVDNTFASPYLQQPLALGADVVVHSTTKYIGGHSDVVGGALVVNDSELGEQLYFLRNAVGSAPGPFDAWLTLRGAKTLAVRMDRHCQNAQRIADMLVSHPAVAEVYYPGLPAHPGHETAVKQMRGFGGMVSFRARGGAGEAVEICGRTRLFTLGESLGGVESLIEHPARMTHASATGSELEVPADLVRLSVGIESVDDLIEDLRTALG